MDDLSRSGASASAPSRRRLKPMAPLDAPDVAKLLAEYGRRTALAGGNPFRAKAYLRAAQSLAAVYALMQCVRSAIGPRP